MKKIKLWLFRRFLPEWCREELIKDNRRLAQELEEANAKTAQLQAYISGMHAVLRVGRKIVIQNGGAGDERLVSSEKQQ